MDAKSGYAKVSCTVNIVFKMATSTHAQFPIFPEESWVTEIIRICVGYMWTGKFDLNAGKRRVGNNEKSNWEANSRCFSYS